MSKRWAGVAGLAGVVAGAGFGLPYLSNAGNCAPPGTPELSCTLNTALAPFVGAIVVGLVAAITIAHVVLALVRRLAAPSPPSQPAPLAAEARDPSLQIASWGMAPRSGPRVVDAIDRDGPAPRRPDYALGSRGRPRPRPRAPG